MKPFQFPASFLLGTATAALQIEGGDRNNSWYRWAETGHIRDGSHCIVACDHWNRVAEDIALMKQLHCRIYRMGLEWSRIEPEPGHFDEAALAHYRDEVEQLLAARIHPLVTLHHFSNPLWLEERGGWLHPETPALFERYTRQVVRTLGDLVAEWITINEPNVYLAMGYIEGLWPPGKKGDIPGYFKGARQMILAHIRSYRALHQERHHLGKSDTRVGVANHLRIFQPKNDTPLERWSCRLYERFFQEIFLMGMGEGRLIFPLGKGRSAGRDRYMDFLGINYYSRDIISGSFNPLNLFGKREVAAGAQVNDLGWEIYPQGIYQICKKYGTRFPIPIYVTENGTCDQRDSFRSRFIYDHLFQLHRAIREGVDVQRYYHWTLMDNFEWVEGFRARFGLIAVDFETQQRTIRRSGHFFGEICRQQGITPEMIGQYLPPASESAQS